MSSAYKGVLRQEARPFRWGNLNQSQKDAFGSIADALEEAIDALGNNQSSSSRRDSDWNPHPLDLNRMARSAFLSGARGTGKTSVLLSLFSALSSFESGEFFSAGEDVYGGQKTQESQDTITKERKEQMELTEYRKQQIERLGRRIIILPTLDLEPLPPSTNLFVALAMRIEKALKYYSSKKHEQHNVFGSLLSDSTSRDLEPLERYNRLQSKIAMVWDQNLPKYTGQSSVESYAEEVKRIEQARTQLPSEFSEVLELLCKDIKTSNTNNPILLLPIDDFDLDPMHCTNLLLLLRMIASPRLFFLLLGQVNIAEMVYRLKVTGDLFSLAGDNSGSLAALPKDLQDDMALHARIISSNAIRKLIPPAHRIELREFNAMESLQFSPAQSKPDTIESLLKQLPMQFFAKEDEHFMDEDKHKIAGYPVENLFQFFVPQSGKEPEQFKYSGLAALQMPPRHINDLWMELKKISRENVKKGEQKKYLGVIEFFYRQLQSQIIEDPTLSIESKKTISTAIRKTEKGEFLLDGRSFANGSVESEFFQFFLEEASLQCHSWQSWRLGYGNLPPSLPNAPMARAPNVLERELNERTASWLILYHDLLSYNRWILVNTLVPNSFYGQSARVSYGDGRVVLPWLVPEWATFWEFEYFQSVWSGALNQVLRANKFYGSFDKIKSMAEKETRYLFYSWIWACTSTFFSDELMHHPTTIFSQFDTKETEKHVWTYIIQQNVKLADWLRRGQDKRSPRFGTARGWIGFLSLMFAPERQSPQDVAEIWFEDQTIQRLLIEDSLIRNFITNIRKEDAKLFTKGYMTPRVQGYYVLESQILQYKNNLRFKINNLNADLLQHVEKLFHSVEELRTIGERGSRIKNLVREFYGFYENLEKLDNLKNVVKTYLKIVSIVFDDKKKNEASYITEIRNNFGEKLKSLETPAGKMIEVLESHETELAELEESEKHQSPLYPINNLALGLFLSPEEIFSHSTTQGVQIPKPSFKHS